MAPKIGYFKKNTLDKYLKALNDIKDILNQNDYETLSNLFRGKKMCSNWVGVLKNNNVIYRNELGYWKWNDKIPVSYKIIEKYKDYNRLKKTETNKLKQQPTLFDKPKTNKTRKIKVEFKDKQQQELGLIRRFLKWIY